MATYYISQSGCDSASGLSPQTPWQTTGRLSERIRKGDTVLLHRGDVFYGGIDLPDGTDAAHRTILSSYGEGEKPKVCLYKIAEKQDAWEEISSMIWRIDLSSRGNYEGNRESDDANVGFLFLDGTICGDKRFALSELRNYWQFYCEESFVYVCSNGNPNSRVSRVCFAVGNGIRLGSHCEVRNLDIFGGGCHGVSGGVCDAVVADCEIHDFGGAHLYTDPRVNVRFGNGVEFWCRGRDITVERNRIYNIYDVGVTMQGFPAPGDGWENVVFRSNVFWGNEQTFEIWTHDRDGGEGIRHCAFQDNICLDAGRGWSHTVRPDKNAGVHLLLYATLCAKHDILIERNVFCDPLSALYYKSFDEPDGKIPADYVTQNNHIFLRPDGYLIDRSEIYRADQWDAFVSESGKERGSILHWLPPEYGTSVYLPNRK